MENEKTYINLSVTVKDDDCHVQINIPHAQQTDVLAAFSSLASSLMKLPNMNAEKIMIATLIGAKNAEEAEDE